jgi:hypothetical protein
MWPNVLRFSRGAPKTIKMTAILHAEDGEAIIAPIAKLPKSLTFEKCAKGCNGAPATLALLRRV